MCFAPVQDSSKAFYLLHVCGPFWVQHGIRNKGLSKFLLPGVQGAGPRGHQCEDDEPRGIQKQYLSSGV